MLALAAGIMATIFFTGVAAASFQLGTSLPQIRKAPASNRTRGLLLLFTLSVIAGISAAVGLLHGNVLLVLGAPLTCMFVRWAITDSPGGPGLIPGFAAMSWACLTGFARFDTWDVGAQLGAQAVVGPALTVLPLPGAVAGGAAALAGLVGAAQWVTSMPHVATSFGHALRWGESALAALVVSAILIGPSMGALVRGGAGELPAVAVSFGAGALCVVAVAALSRLIEARPWGLKGGLSRWVPSAVAFAALGVAVVVD